MSVQKVLTGEAQEPRLDPGARARHAPLPLPEPWKPLGRMVALSPPLGLRGGTRSPEKDSQPKHRLFHTVGETEAHRARGCWSSFDRRTGKGALRSPPHPALTPLSAFLLGPPKSRGGKLLALREGWALGRKPWGN